MEATNALAQRFGSRALRFAIAATGTVFSRTADIALRNISPGLGPLSSSLTLGWIAAPVLAAYFLSARTLPNFRKQFSWTLPVCPGKGSSKKARLGDHSSLPADSLQFGRRLLSEGRSGVSVEAYIEGCAIVSRSN